MPEVNEVLFIDDEQHVRQAARQTLELAGLQATCMQSAAEALPMLGPEYAGVVVSDIRMPGLDGLGFLQRALAQDGDLPIILITGHGDVATAVQAMRDGAYDFLEKPYAQQALTETVRRALDKRTLTLENRALRERLLQQGDNAPRLLGRSAAMTRLRSLIRQVADTDADVLVWGATGTGKELVARSLHEHSGRKGRFVAVNCGALPADLIESELFGHEPGAFTGARTKRVGKLEYASGGTLFLDEIESMPLELQVRLLRVLQERAVERLGANESTALDLRVVAATKVDLRAAADRGEFREDLYYRLNVVTLEIPSLRQRPDDIPLLFQHFAIEAGIRYRREPAPLSALSRARLTAHEWPGNVRELRNAAERWVLLGEQAALQMGDTVEPAEKGSRTDLRTQVARLERDLIAAELRAHDGNISRATVALGLPRKTLHYKIRRYGLDRDPDGPASDEI